MTLHERDVLFYGGGAALEKYGVFLRRTQTPRFGGEELIETFTRTGTASYVDRDGVLRLAASGVMRPHFPLVDGSRVLHVLLEGTRANLFLWSEGFDNVAWSKLLASVVDEQFTAPDGTMTAERLLEDTSTGVHFVRQGVTATADATYALSVFAKDTGEGRNWIVLRLIDSGGGNSVQAFFNVNTGVIGTTSAGGTAAFVRATVETLASGWYRCTLVGSIGSAATAINGDVCLASADNTLTYTGDGASALGIWGAQFENSANFSSSYIKTTTAAVTRNADSLSATFLAPPQEMTVYLDFQNLAGPNWDDARHVVIGANNENRPRLLVYGLGGSDSYRILHGNSAGDVTSTVDVDPSFRDRIELRALINADGSVQIGCAKNSTAEVVGTVSGANSLASAWTAQTISIGSRFGSLSTFTALRALMVARGTRFSLDDFRGWVPS